MQQKKSSKLAFCIFVSIRSGRTVDRVTRLRCGGSADAIVNVSHPALPWSACTCCGEQGYASAPLPLRSHGSSRNTLTDSGGRTRTFRLTGRRIHQCNRAYRARTDTADRRFSAVSVRVVLDQSPTHLRAVVTPAR